jgi:hypothetical protein
MEDRIMATKLAYVMCAIATAALATGASAAEKKTTAAKKPAPSDSSMTIPGSAGGKNLDSITIEGEDRVRVQFERPPLNLALDPSTARGLDWDAFWTVLAPESFDFVGSLYARSATVRAPYAPRPWLDEFRTGPVAKFRPAVSGVETWKLEVADSRGQTVAKFEGTGSPPKEIAWDGATATGPARADLTYSYVLHAMDKAGNKRSFVGSSFQIPPHLDTAKGEQRMTFAVGLDAASIAEAYVMEAASRINDAGSALAPVRVQVTAPTFALAKSIADQIVEALRVELRGDAARVTSTTQVDAGGGERASVVIQWGAPAPDPKKS